MMQKRSAAPPAARADHAAACARKGDRWKMAWIQVRLLSARRCTAVLVILTYRPAVHARFIPEGTAVDVPIYVVQRDPRNFSPAPEDFWPERWLASGPGSGPKPTATPYGVPKTEGDLVVHNLPAFIPFSWGPALCAGKNLALAEMRAVVAVLMQRFELRLADSDSDSDVKQAYESALRDVFLFQVGKLPVLVRTRS